MDIDPHDLFEQLFGAQMGGRQRRPRGPRRGQDLQLRMKLSFLEAVSEQRARMRRVQECLRILSSPRVTQERVES